ncbi:MAG TPA: FMN-binding negative transcriptional regulator [Micropepsaceae bacterium]|nr:FMN-binding negative transcriptional regulator [Micropepsaceae bacterium]
MYIPAAFQLSDRAVLHEFVRTHSFAVMAGVIGGEIHLAYAPTLFITDSGHGRVQFHLARANPMAALEDGQPAKVSFMGPHSYISPNWYKSSQVPTWNYLAAEGSGPVRRLNTEELRRQLTALAAQHEAYAAPDNRWSPEKLNPEQMTALLKAIVGFEVELVSLEGKLKLSQNKSQADIAGAIAGLEKSNDEASRAIAAVMRKYALQG